MMSNKDIAKITLYVCLFILGLEVFLYLASVVLAYLNLDRALSLSVTYSMIAIIPSLGYILTIFPLAALLINKSYSHLKWAALVVIGIIIFVILGEAVGRYALGGPSMFKGTMRGLFYFGTFSFLPFNILAWILFTNKRLSQSE